MTVLNTIQATDLIQDCLQAGVVPMLTGSPGIGKSAVMLNIARTAGLLVIDMRLASCDPTDLNGFPRVDPVTGKGTYAPMDTFPLETDEIPDGYNGWLLLLDEMNSAPQMVQAACYKLILDHAVGLNKLHPMCFIVAAGNKDTDGAIVEDLGTAMQSRMIHLEMGVDVKTWLEWAQNNGVDHRITSYIKYKPSALYQFRADHDDKTFACPRTWEFASNLLTLWPGNIPSAKRPLLDGCISVAAATELVGFCKIYGQLPSAAEIAKNPTTTPVPVEPNHKFATCGTIANHITIDSAEALLTYVDRLPVEFQVICLKEMMKRKRELLDTSIHIKRWVTKNAAKLF